MNEKLQINEKLYKYQTIHGVITYTISAVIEREDVILYELACSNCFHGRQECRLLVTLEPNKRYYQFVSMVDEDSDDRQFFWHTTYTRGEGFYLTENEAKKQIYLSKIEDVKKEIENKKTSLKNSEERLQELEAHYNNIFNLSPTPPPQK